MKQTDELENFVSKKINIIENLIESMKKSVSQIQLMQYEAASGGNKDINDTSFISSRKISSIDKPSFTNQNTSLPHDVGLSRRKKSTINKPPFANQNAFLPRRENLT